MCNIVIVEDESLERLALRTILADKLPECTILGEAATGAEAIAFIDAGGIDLMLVDINIPWPNGLEVLQYLRQKSPDTKVIITTAHDKFDMAREALRLKVDEYLLKPIRPQLLVDTIQTCLDFRNGHSRVLRDMVKQVSACLAQNFYQEAVALLRRYTNSCYDQKETPPEQLLRDLGDVLVQLGKDKGLNTETVQSHAKRLYTMRLDARSRNKAIDTILSTLDGLFEAAQISFGHTSNPMEKALNYIERHLYRGTTLEEAAESAHVSSCYLSRLFKKNLGINFIAYITRRRMELAKEYLQRSDLPINTISLELSYSDLNYFCKSFKKEVGMSPSEYRKQTKEPL